MQLNINMDLFFALYSLAEQSQLQYRHFPHHLKIHMIRNGQVCKQQAVTLKSATDLMTQHLTIPLLSCLVLVPRKKSLDKMSTHSGSSSSSSSRGLLGRRSKNEIGVSIVV